MNEHDIPPSFQIGSPVTNGKGENGIYVGNTVNEFGDVAQIQLENYLLTIPLPRFYTIYSPGQSAPVEIETKLTRDAIRTHIRNSKRNALNNFAAEPTPEVEIEFTSLISEAEQNDYVFRGSAHHPYAQGWFDKLEQVPEKKSVFAVGFDGNSDSELKKIYLSADISRAVQYPSETRFPQGWDKIRYLYVIHPQTLYTRPQAVVINETHDEIVVDRVPPQHIVACVSIESGRDSNRTIREVFPNPAFLKKL